MIGINGMGWSDLTAILKVPGVNLVALCDVDKNVLDRRMKDLAKMNVDASKIKTFNITASYWILKKWMRLSSAHPITGIVCKW